MANNTLDERDRVVLESLHEGGEDTESLADSVTESAESLRERLAELADDGLVESTDSGGYALTANGQRVIAASGDGATDNRIDTPPEVEREIESFDLSPDETEAVRDAFAFLHYWGTASAGEIIDGVFSETPAAFESGTEWWTELVRDRLGSLPSVEPPKRTDREWRYSGTPTVEEPNEDGRIVVSDDEGAQSSVKYALERLSLDDDERDAVRAAFDLLVREGELRATEIRDRVYPDHAAGYESPSEWWNDCVRGAFESLPGVECRDATDDVWEYR
ncbi:hypothetical protein SAMN04488063_3271 [Halopelagius inordinatus]|uniref:Uncharacterized protein n=1 Tax=Halopelagius inordinatus TaxID=553467 RepID=A0A1I2VPX8_9EURY|nr:hypothetical protein [Halopelagius inordinatus]SFG91385.1 hypothetical protein SAMN04488063_3271 [Halopelagius inordinatus]